MFGIAGSFIVGYLAATGLITNAAITARGVKRAVSSAVHGDLRAARSHLFAAATAPAYIAVSAITAFVCEVIHHAEDLGDPALSHIFDRQSMAL